MHAVVRRILKKTPKQNSQLEGKKIEHLMHIRRRALKITTEQKLIGRNKGDYHRGSLQDSLEICNLKESASRAVWVPNSIPADQLHLDV